MDNIHSKPKAGKEIGINDADIIVDLSGGRLLVQKLRRELKAKDEEIEQLETENKQLRDGLIEIRKSTEIMEARRFAGQALLKDKPL